MIRNIAIAIGLCLFAVNAQAKPISFLNSLSSMPAVSNSKTDTDNCKNFSGTWKGYCAASPEQSSRVEETFTLKQQGCELIQVEAKDNNMNIPLPIGGMFSIGGAMPGTPAVVFGTSINSNWDKDHKVLSLYVAGGGKALTIDSATSGFYVKEDMQLVNDKKLTVDVMVAGQANKTVCEFDKQ